MYVASGGDCYTHTKRWTCSWLSNTWNFAFHSELFCHLSITSCSHEKRYQALPLLLTTSNEKLGGAWGHVCQCSLNTYTGGFNSCMKWSLYSYPITTKSQGYQFTCSTAPHVSLRQSHIPSVSSERHTETPAVKTRMTMLKLPHDCKDYEASGIGNNA